MVLDQGASKGPKGAPGIAPATVAEIRRLCHRLGTSRGVGEFNNPIVFICTLLMSSVDRTGAARADDPVDVYFVPVIVKKAALSGTFSGGPRCRSPNPTMSYVLVPTE
jgi:hypothetical protein